jgi:RNA polymerase sigma-70 factor, ECF subfamily
MRPKMTDSDSQPTSPTLLGGVREGDSGAWEQLVFHYQPIILQWVKQKGFDRATSLDIAQETFLSVSKSLPTFLARPGTGAFRAWLWRIVQRRIIDYRRRVARQPIAIGGSTMTGQIGQSIDPASQDGSSVQRMSASMQQRLDEVAKGYQARTWQAFLRSVVDGRTTQEVADEFQMTSVGVRQLRSRILRQLRVTHPKPTR